MRLKGSGILRYMFGQVDGYQTVTGGYPQMVGGDATRFINVLGGVAGVPDPDVDNQAFGGSAGSGSIAAGIGLFSAAAPVVAWNAPTLVPQVGGPAQPKNDLQYIPASTRVTAWFQLASAVLAPTVVVQVRTVNSPALRGGSFIPAIPAFTWLAFAQIAIKNIAANTTIAAGTLFVKLEHSRIDVPSEFPVVPTQTGAAVSPP